MDLIEKIVVVVVLVSGLFFLLQVLPRIVNKRRVNDDYIKSFKDGLKFNQHSKMILTGSISDYYVVLDFYIPTISSLKNNPEILLEMNYKPDSDVTSQEKRMKFYREKYPEFHWIANCARTRIEIKRDRPTVEKIKAVLSKMESILKSESLAGISAAESEEYSDFWDDDSRY